MLKSLWNWSRNVQCWGQQKIFKESARDIKERKSNKQYSLATLGNSSLPEAREEPKKPANPFRPHSLYALHPMLLTVCIITFDAS